MIDWDLATKIFTYGLGTVFASLAVLIAAIYIFGAILKAIEKKDN